MPDTKKCRGRCKRDLPLDEFALNRRAPDGRQHICRKCRQDRYLSEREEVIEAKRRWRRANRSRVRAYERRRSADYRERAGDRIRTRARATAAVRYALQSGRLTRPNACEKCGAEGPVQGHHHDGYGPQHRLDVEWLCPNCHGSRHRCWRRSREPSRSAR